MRTAINEAQEFGKVAVLTGGHSAEREISLKSGQAVLEALIARGVDAHAIDVGDDLYQQLTAGDYQRAFIALHGKGGEDGVIQGVLETLKIPYTGSGVLASALGMDKLRSKLLWAGAGLLTPPFRELSEHSDYTAVAEELGLPLIVKPATEGSSLGMSKVSAVDELQDAWHKAAFLGESVLAEKWIEGIEYTAAILQGEALPLIAVETPRAFYDYAAKYEQEDTRYLCPCGLDEEQEGELQTLALHAFEIIGCQGWGRVDFMCDEQGRPWLIEVNTVPGMTDHSLVPMAAQAAGIEFDELVWRILETSITETTVRH